MSRHCGARITELRNLPLDVVAAALGYQRTANDRSKWKAANSILSINQTQFYDHVRLTGGGGAIDLVVHANQCGFSDAIAFLETMAPPQNVQAPQPTHWHTVKHYLCRQRGLDPELLENCYRQGLISADARNNAVFAMRNAVGERMGAEIVGTAANRRFKGLAKGSHKQSAGFWICRTGHRQVSRCHSALLVESAIDALSVLCLSLPDLPELIISTAGLAYVLPKWLADIDADRIVCGYDADEPAHLAAQSLCQDPRIVRWLPDNEKDWNDLLLKKQH